MRLNLVRSTHVRASWAPFGLAFALSVTLVACDGGGTAVPLAPGPDSAADVASTRDAGPADAAGLPDVATDTGGAIDAVEDAARDAICDADAGGNTDASGNTDVGAEECPAPSDPLPGLSVRAEGRYRYVDAFPVDGLASRTVRVYLPADYDAAGDRRYPVIYMHDGQNLFDSADAAFGEEWEVDETVDALVLAGLIPPVLVVGVDNTDARLDEYRAGPDPSIEDGSAAEAYRLFLAERLKPWVDAHYRTRCGRRDTVLIGSSMGGVASVASALAYPEVWGRVGALSTSFWYGDYELFLWLTGHSPRRLPERFWLDVGTDESSTGAGSDSFVLDTRGVRDRLRNLGMAVGEDLGYREAIGGIHNERDWARRLPNLLRFLLGPPLTTSTAALDLTLDPFETTLLEAGEGTELAVQTSVDGVALTLPNDGFTFRSDDEAVVAVDERGHVRAIGSGHTRLTATDGDREAVAEITVVSRPIVTFRVTVPASTPEYATVYLSGDRPELGDWDGQGVALSPLGDKRWEARIPLPPDTPIAYKYTRGSWATVEKLEDGEERPDRSATTHDGLVLDDTVERWADD